MSDDSHPAAPTRPLQSLAKMAPTILVLAVLGVGWLAIHHLIQSTGESEVSSEGDGADAALTDALALPQGKLDAAKLQSVAAENQSLQHVHTVPGRIRYDESKHIDVRAPMDGILAEVLVTPGEQVKEGQLLAVLRSPEIGRARAAILKCKQQREIAQQILERETRVEQNLQTLLSMVKQRSSPDEIEATFSDRSLGSYRQDILSAYSKLRLSNQVLEKISPLADSGAVSGRAVREREAERQIAETEFRTACDQATFAASKSRMQAEADLAEADRQLNLAWQAVETLLGYQEDRSTVSLSDQEALSRLEVRAPFAATVESRQYANNERVSSGDSLFVLADTRSLYVAASIRENDWSAVVLQPGAKVTVRVPALDDQEFDATIKYVGREVESGTNSVPLIATIDNRDGLLRPGMFVRVTVPIGQARTALAIKPESVIQHENQKFVFVDTSNGTYKRVDVTTGQSSEDWVEVVDGLSPGQLVVTDGAFLLKSELLLQGEAE
ncbi:efflux RND transporter periplasmic adaptor subunit [Roseiconus nitratireducens]|uniref:Efflux RND transporter periplasmic adaptor subunit n=1 Tax=Roseiconus nitratireducens TaxID=2605748 RepID=A0A5M6CZ45_9BACT|nr:efflux RND transporter periplasmic adaptor subunit [Roseiconus nitratireducens]KAA5539690.1 efflux RND transporter periplasmic adaptor subunit [Roseiconus nitratireducens]